MYNYKSTLLILLLGIVLIVPTVYCFTLFSPSPDSKEKVDEGQNDAPHATIIDVVPPIAMNDTTKDSSINDDEIIIDSPTDDDVTSEDSSMDDDVTSEDSSIDDDVTSEDSSIDEDDTAKDPSTNGSESSSISWPVILIVDDKGAQVNVESESDSRRVDSSNNWLVINKKSRIRRVEEESRDFGKNRKVFSEDKDEELRIYRDNFHSVVRNGVDITNWLRL